MKITIDRAHLADALTWVAQVIPPRPAMAALAGVKIVAGDAGVEVSAFDFESYHAARVECIAGEPGAVLVPGIVLRDVVNAAGSDDVTLADDGARLTVTAGRATYTLALLVLEDHPKAPPVPVQVGTVDGEMLAWLVQALRHVTARVDGNPTLAGLRLHTHGGDTLRAVGSDRYRVGLVDLPWTGDDFDVLPDHDHLTAAVKGLTGTVAVHAEGGRLALVTERRTVVLRCIDGQHPDVAKAIPPAGSFVTTIDCDGADLKAALKRLRAVDIGRVPTRIQATADGLEITLAGTDHGGDEYVDAKVSQPITFHVNAGYLADALPDGPVSLGLVGSFRPFAVIDPDRPQLAQALMPIRHP